jgi:hypothetical protein
MAALVWNVSAEKFYESGLDRGTLYVRDGSGDYTPGIAWEGLMAVTEKPGGAEPTDLWANNVLYAKLVSPEIFDGSIEAYQFPDEWYACDGVAPHATHLGTYIGQQSRSTFGLSYRTRVGSDAGGDVLAYKIHCVYGCLASPSEVARNTINDSPESATFSWEFKTTPVSMTGFSALSKLTFDTRTLTVGNLTALEAALWGLDDVTAPNLPLPDALMALFT